MTATGPHPDALALAERVHTALLERDASLAVAESLTGGLVAAVLTDVPGASRTFLGGITAYATAAKSALLGVDAGLLARAGAVDPDVAIAMARGVRDRFASTYGLATTGVAGPDPQDGREPGTVYVACSGRRSADVLALALSGDRGEVRRQTVLAVLTLLLDQLDPTSDRGGKQIG